MKTEERRNIEKRLMKNGFEKISGNARKIKTYKSKSGNNAIVFREKDYLLYGHDMTVIRGDEVIKGVRVACYGYYDLNTMEVVNNRLLVNYESGLTIITEEIA